VIGASLHPKKLQKKSLGKGVIACAITHISYRKSQKKIKMIQWIYEL